MTRLTALMGLLTPAAAVAASPEVSLRGAQVRATCERVVFFSRVSKIDVMIYPCRAGRGFFFSILRFLVPAVAHSLPLMLRVKSCRETSHTDNCCALARTHVHKRRATRTRNDGKHGDTTHTTPGVSFYSAATLCNGRLPWWTHVCIFFF